MLTVATYLAPSPIHGIGIFAAEPIFEGTVVAAFEPTLDLALTKAEVKALHPAARIQVLKYAYFSKNYRRYVLCGDDARFFNHSSTPNCLDLSVQAVDITLAARDIQAGEELTTDYSTFDGKHSAGSLGQGPTGS